MLITPWAHALEPREAADELFTGKLAHDARVEVTTQHEQHGLKKEL